MCFLNSCVTVRGTDSNKILLPSTRNDIDDLWNAINVQQQKLAEQSQIISTQQEIIDSLPKFCQGRTSYRNGKLIFGMESAFTSLSIPHTVSLNKHHHILQVYLVHNIIILQRE